MTTWALRVRMVLAAFVTAVVAQGLVSLPVHADPGPICRPFANAPQEVVPPSPAGPGHWQFTAQVIVGLHCNFTVNNTNATPIFHSNVNGVGHVFTGSTRFCGVSGSCTASINVTRTFQCDIIYSFNDFGEVHAQFQIHKGDTFVNTSTTGPHTTGSALNPRGSGC